MVEIPANCGRKFYSDVNEFEKMQDSFIPDSVRKLKTSMIEQYWLKSQYTKNFFREAKQVFRALMAIAVVE